MYNKRNISGDLPCLLVAVVVSDSQMNDVVKASFIQGKSRIFHQENPNKGAWDIPCKKQDGSRLSKSRLSELRIENYDFCKLKVK